MGIRERWVMGKVLGRVMGIKVGGCWGEVGDGKDG